MGLMQDARYYRRVAETARRLKGKAAPRRVAELLERVAEDYDDVADDLETHAIDVRHPELMKQRKHHR
jgi:hypothetical protein